MKKVGLSYVELSDKGCEMLVLENLRVREEVFGGSGEIFMSDKTSKALAFTMIQLFESVAIKKKWLHRDHKEYKDMEYKMTMTMRGSASEYNYIVPTKFVLVFTDMYKAISKGTKVTYEMGLEKGKNLLVGLNDGSLTLNDFNKNKEDDE